MQVKVVPAKIPFYAGALTKVGRVIEIKHDRFRTEKGWFNVFEYEPVFITVNNIICSPELDYLIDKSEVSEDEIELIEVKHLHEIGQRGCNVYKKNSDAFKT